MKRKKAGGIESIKRRFGYYFTAPWVFGVAVFVILPLFTSFYYSFTNISIGPDGVQTTFAGLKHYRYLLFEDPNYINLTLGSFSTLVTSLPIIMAMSMILAMILNQKFKGRLIARSVFFLPVIIGSGVVMNTLSGFSMSQDLMTSFGNTDSAMTTYMEIIDFSELLYRLNLPDAVNNLIAGYLRDTFNLIWSCGIQILLFIAGLQTIPQHLYEAGRVEGATAWEEFWYITIPMLGRVILLVLFYTMVELFIEKGVLVAQAMPLIRRQSYDVVSAMLWPYFALVGLVIGAVIFVYDRVCLKKWE